MFIPKIWDLLWIETTCDFPVTETETRPGAVAWNRWPCRPCILRLGLSQTTEHWMRWEKTSCWRHITNLNWAMNGRWMEVGVCKQFPSSQYITIHVCNITAGDYPHIYNLSSLLGLYMFILSKHYEVELRRETYWFVGINGKWQITMYIFGFNCWQVWLVLLFFRVCFTAICHPTWDEDRHEYVFQGLGHPEQTGIESIN